MCIDKVGEEGAGLTGEVVSTGVPEHMTQSGDVALDIIRSRAALGGLQLGTVDEAG